jgi:hypothetical protein
MLHSFHKLIEAAQPTLPAGVTILGVDAYGVDYRTDALRQRIVFKSGPVVADAADAALVRAFGK